MCWFSSAPTSLPIEPSGPGPPTVAVARDRSEVRRCASDRSHSWVSRSRSTGVCRSGRDAHSETASEMVPAPRRLPLPPSALRSFISVVIATPQPLPTSPRRCASGMRASVKYTSLNSAWPVSWRSGRVSTPGACMSMTK